MREQTPLRSASDKNCARGTRVRINKEKREGKSTTPRAVTSVPTRKISETLLEFAEPVLDALGPVADAELVRHALQLAINAWNVHAMSMPVWGNPHFLSEARAAINAPGAPSELSILFERLLERRATVYGSDPRVVGEWNLRTDGAGGFSLRCDARLPRGCVD